MVANDGSDVAFHGEYREVVTVERIVYTEMLEGSLRAEALTTVTFTEHGRRHDRGDPGAVRERAGS